MMLQDLVSFVQTLESRLFREDLSFQVHLYILLLLDLSSQFTDDHVFLCNHIVELSRLFDVFFFISFCNFIDKHLPLVLVRLFEEKLIDL